MRAKDRVSALQLWAGLNRVEPLPRMEGLPLPPQQRDPVEPAPLPRCALV